MIKTYLRSLAASVVLLSTAGASLAGDVSREIFAGTSGGVQSFTDGKPLPGPDQFKFRVNGDADLVDFSKTGSDREMSMLWKIENNKFCMVRVLNIRGEYICYKVKPQKDGTIELKNNRASKDNMPERILLSPK
jgi:hypothetical protein